MQSILMIALFSAFVQAMCAVPHLPAQSVNRPVTLDTAIDVPEASGGNAFSDLIAIGVANHLPIGVTVGDDPETSLCGTPLGFEHGSITVSDLITKIGNEIPGYAARLEGGVLDVAPLNPSGGVVNLLELRISHFRGSAGPHVLLGRELWGAIRGTVAPGEGVDLSGLFSLSSEIVPAMDMTNSTVKSILDAIVLKGSGGVWVLRASEVKTLPLTTQMPYEIHGYVGEEQLLAKGLQCR